MMTQEVSRDHDRVEPTPTRRGRGKLGISPPPADKKRNGEEPVALGSGTGKYK
jgi:hypothetical protein